MEVEIEVCDTVEASIKQHLVPAYFEHGAVVVLGQGFRGIGSTIPTHHP